MESYEGRQIPRRQPENRPTHSMRLPACTRSGTVCELYRPRRAKRPTAELGLESEVRSASVFLARVLLRSQSWLVNGKVLPDIDSPKTDN